MSLDMFALSLCKEFTVDMAISVLDKLCIHFRQHATYRRMLSLKSKYGISITSNILRGKEFNVFKCIYKYICDNNKYTDIVLVLINMKYSCRKLCGKMTICTNRKLSDETAVAISNFYVDMFGKRLIIAFTVNERNISEISIEVKNVVYRYNVYKDVANAILNNYNYSIWKIEKQQKD